ncbi:helix-turn-helix domain-containing protein [Caballeronia sp. KNU42]
MDYGTHIRRIREARGLTVQKLASEVGINGGSLSKIERNIEGASVETLEVIAQALQIPIAQLFIRDDGTEDARAIPVGRTTLVIGEARCHAADGSFEERRYVRGEGGYVRHVSTDAHAYALKIKGDSLRPRYHPGEYVVVAISADPQPSQDVVVRLKGGRAMITNFVGILDDEAEFASVNSGEKITIARAEISSIHPIAGHYPRGSTY